MPDTQNKANFVSTAVTIASLSLSFFTSYFGMILQGIQGTDWREGDFWKGCGSLSLTLLSLTVLYTFRHQIYRTMMSYRPDEDALAG